MGPIVGALVRGGAETLLRRFPFVFEVQYWLISVFGPTRRFGSWLGHRLGGPGLRRLVARRRPDVVVSTYPGTTEVLGWLRSRGKLEVPLVAAITDLAALRFWAHPQMDRHLLIHPESAEEVAALIGGLDGVRTTRGLVRPEYEHPPSREAAREALGLPAAAKVVLVSGGGWGVGDVAAAVRTVLAIPGAVAIALCGTHDALRDRLARAYEGDPRVRVLGFTDEMCAWLSASDVLVHSTAGLTVLEAQLCGTHAVSFGWGIGHIRINNRAYRRFGLAHVAESPQELAALLPRLLATPRAIDLDYAALPAAADVVLELTRSGSPAPSR
jgi:UDP-N-acetylglucosamine:LPS N-acetylglucosamine transferase